MPSPVVIQTPCHAAPIRGICKLLKKKDLCGTHQAALEPEMRQDVALARGASTWQTVHRHRSPGAQAEPRWPSEVLNDLPRRDQAGTTLLIDAAGLQPTLSEFCLEVFADVVGLHCPGKLASRAVLMAAGMA